MSTGQAAVLTPARTRRRLPEESAPFLKLAGRFTPAQGWDTFLLMVAAVGVAAGSVRDSNWVETPGMIPIVLLSCLTGLLLAKVRGPWPLLYLAGLALGLAVVVWQTLSLIESQPRADQVRELWNRLTVWYDVATSGGISTDLLPFTLALLSLAWVLGYVSTWFLFRSTNVWVGLVLAGLTIMTNLSFDPPGPLALSFFLFMFLAMLLVARVSTIQRQDQWRTDKIGFSSNSAWLGIRAAAGLTVVVLVIAAILPVKVYVSDTARQIWTLGRSPIESMENEFGRLFYGVPARRDLSGRFFGTALPFQGKVKFTGEVVLETHSAQPSNWLSRTYSRYTSQGWFAGKTKKLRVGPDSLDPPPQESFNRASVTQTLRPSFSSFGLLTGGNLDWVSREAIAETLVPLEFEIHLMDASNDGELPRDIQDLAQDLRQTLERSQQDVAEPIIAKMLPVDLVLVSVYPESQSGESRLPEKVLLARKEPTLPDVVAWRFAQRLEADETYVMSSFVSEVSTDLRTAGTNYSSFIKDHYLQLPASLPQRVRNLAAVLTREADTPLDKALALEEYLRGSTFEYSRNIDKPPRDADAVDHLLFETKIGYSDYFASSMAVMLRSVGVPARLAAGYAPGILKDRTGRRLVKDSDSHGWTQVYFPGHGWIDFEPTAAWPLPQRGELSRPAAAGPAERQSAPEDEEFLPEVPENPFEECIDSAFSLEDELACLASQDTQTVDEEPSLDSWWSPANLAVPIAIGVAALAGLWLIMWYMLVRGLRRASPEERAYTKMSRLGTLAGIRRDSHLTPFEYANVLGGAIPAIAAGAQAVARAFAAGRYGRQELADDDLKELDEGWRGIKGRLLARALRRLVPV